VNFQPHPTFSKWFGRFFLRAWIVLAILTVAGLILLKSGFEVVGGAFFMAFIPSILWTLWYSSYRLYHIKCPTCGGITKTKARPITYGSYIAYCKSCDISWDLGIGFGD
jgi:hypothetical protein